VDARAWTTSDGPRAIFNDAIGWLFERGVLLPGVTTLARLVARVREEATERLWGTLVGLLTAGQCRQLERLLEVPDVRRFSDLERWRKGPAKPSGRNLEKAIARVAEIKALGLGSLDLDAVVAHRRLVDLARYGMTVNARALRRHPRSRRLATLLATVVFLEASAADDCLELLDLLMATELLGKAERESVKEKARQHPRLARASAKLATAVEVLLDVTARGEQLGLDEVWELIDAVVSRGELRAAVAAITELVPPDVDDDGVKRAQLATRITPVNVFRRAPTAGQPSVAWSARAFRANDQYGLIGVVNDSARDAAQQHVRQPALPARADDDGASVVFGGEVKDRAPDVPGARNDRLGVEAYFARESGTLFGGRSSVGALEFVDLAEDGGVGGGSRGCADHALGGGPDCGDERWAGSEQLTGCRDRRFRVIGPVVCDEDRAFRHAFSLLSWVGDRSGRPAQTGAAHSGLDWPLSSPDSLGGATGEVRDRALTVPRGDHGDRKP
jgi:hypothetical protein